MLFNLENTNFFPKETHMKKLGEILMAKNSFEEILMGNEVVVRAMIETGTTAMTGHQDHAGNKIPIEGLLKGLGIESILSCDTYNQSKLTDIVKTSLKIKGISVVIAKHPCMLKFTRLQRKKSDFVQKHITIDQKICNQTHDCVERFGLPYIYSEPG